MIPIDRPSTPVIDRTARNQAAQLLGRWQAGTITNWELEDTWPHSDDRAVKAVGDRLWCLYSDFPRRMLDLSSLRREEKDLFDRCRTFLKSGTDYRWPDFDFVREGLRPMEVLFRGMRTKSQGWEVFARAGDIGSWPFLTRVDYEQNSR